jgi:hypothetical protein
VHTKKHISEYRTRFLLGIAFRIVSKKRTGADQAVRSPVGTTKQTHGLRRPRAGPAATVGGQVPPNRTPSCSWTTPWVAQRQYLGRYRWASVAGVPPRLHAAHRGILLRRCHPLRCRCGYMPRCSRCPLCRRGPPRRAAASPLQWRGRAHRCVLPSAACPPPRPRSHHATMPRTWRCAGATVRNHAAPRCRCWTCDCASSIRGHVVSPSHAPMASLLQQRRRRRGVGCRRGGACEVGGRGSRLGFATICVPRFTG